MCIRDIARVRNKRLIAHINQTSPFWERNRGHPWRVEPQLHQTVFVKRHADDFPPVLGDELPWMEPKVPFTSRTVAVESTNAHDTFDVWSVHLQRVIGSTWHTLVHGLVCG